MSIPEHDYSEIPLSPEFPDAPAQQAAPVPGLPLTELTPERIALAVQQIRQAEAKVQPDPSITEWHEIDEADYAKLKVPGKWTTAMKFAKESIFAGEFANFRHVLVAVLDAACVYSMPKNDGLLEGREKTAMLAVNRLMAQQMATVSRSCGQRFKIELLHGLLKTLRKDLEGDADMPRVSLVSGYDGEEEVDSKGAVNCHRARVRNMINDHAVKAWKRTEQDNAVREKGKQLKRKPAEATNIQKLGKKPRGGALTTPHDSSSSDGRSPSPCNTPVFLRAEARLLASESSLAQSKADERASQAREVEAISRERIEVRKLEVEECRLAQKREDRAAEREDRVAEREERRLAQPRSDRRQDKMIEAMMMILQKVTQGGAPQSLNDTVACMHCGWSSAQRVPLIESGLAD